MADVGNTYYDTVKLIQEKLLVHGLKNILKQLRISSTGRKAHLQSRLIDYLSAGLRRDGDSRIAHVHNMVLEELNLPGRSTITAHPAPLSTASTIASAAPNHQQELHSQLAHVEFNSSPFYTLERLLGNPLLLPITLREMPAKLSMSFEVNIDQLPPDASYDVLLLSTMYPFISQNKSIMQFPLQFEVRVNQQQLQLNGYRGVKGKPGTAKAQVLTGLVSSYHRNLIEVTVNDVPQYYGMFVYLVRNVPLDTLLKRIDSHQHISKESTVQQIVNENNQDSDDEIQTLSTILSLKCPLSYCRIETPVRSIHCKHIECFDAKSFLQLQQQATTWTCPICNKVLDFDSLAVDDYLYEILQLLKDDDTDEIEINQNGGWKIKQEETEDPFAHNNDTTTHVKREESGELAGRDSENVEIISLSDTDEEDDDNDYGDLRLPGIPGEQSRVLPPLPIVDRPAPITDPDLFSSLPDWENSMFNRRNVDANGAARNGTTPSSNNINNYQSPRNGTSANYRNNNNNGYAPGTNGAAANGNRSWLPSLSTLVSQQQQQQQQNQSPGPRIDLDNVIDLTLSDDDD
jgi:E3 SUMO-protein ligase PIAS1